MRKRKNPFDTREQYLVAAAKAMNTDLLIKKASTKLPDVFYVSVMEPAGKVIGRAWPASHEAHHIFVSAALDEPVQVLATLLHEMIHISVGVDQKHNAVFGAACTAVGLEGKRTSTYAGDELAEYLRVLNTSLGGYPHRPLERKLKPTKGGKRVKYVSPNDAGFYVYITPKLVEDFGAPRDWEGDEMEPA